MPKVNKRLFKTSLEKRAAFGGKPLIYPLIAESNFSISITISDEVIKGGNLIGAFESIFRNPQSVNKNV